MPDGVDFAPAMPGRPKIRVLIVSFNLGQGGSERFIYEYCKAIDRERFDVEILTKPRTNPVEYYIPKLEALGIPIHYGLPRFLHLARRFARPLYAPPPGRFLIESMHRLMMRFLIGDMLERFDVLQAIQIENYHLLQPLLRDNRKVITHLMSHAVQYPVNPYVDCRPGRLYRFVLFDPAQVNDLSGTPAEGAETLDFPLALDPRPFADLSAIPNGTKPYRIGIFQRLHPKEHPFEGFFAAFRRILESVDAELIVYGRGNPAVFARDLDRHGIAAKVKFMGHRPSIEAALREDGLSLVWQISIGGAVGYSSIEIASYGFPLLLWNIIETNSDDAARESGGAMRSYHDPDALAADTLRCLESRERLRAGGAALRQYAIQRYDIYRHINRLQDKLEAIAETANRVNG
jgi:glycosyltransferase involved in cell wall biosynthesis